MADIITEMAKAYGVTEEHVLQLVHDRLLEKAPEIILTKNENDKIKCHLANCELARSQTPFIWNKQEPIDVDDTCTCMTQHRAARNK